MSKNFRTTLNLLKKLNLQKIEHLTIILKLSLPGIQISSDKNIPSKKVRIYLFNNDLLGVSVEVQAFGRLDLA